MSKRENGNSVKRYRIVVGLVALCVALSCASTQTARADEVEGATTGGPVSGTIRADDTYKIGWCAVACFRNYDFGEDEDGNKLSKPEYYPVTTNSNGDFTDFSVSDETVGTGTYKIAYYGVEDSEARRGYLKRKPDGTYKVADSFSQGTGFTVEEGRSLHLGTLALIQFPSSATAYSDATLYNYGGAAGNKTHLFHIPKGVKVVVRSYGCGKLQTTKTVARSGTYNYQWTDSKAYKHYSKMLRLQVSFVQGSKVRTFESRSWSVTKFGWHC